MELKIAASEFQKRLLKYKSEFEELEKSKIDNEKELLESKEKFKSLKDDCSKYITDNTSPDIGGEFSQLISDENRYQIPNQGKVDFHHSKKNFLDRIKNRTNNIDYLLQIVELSDPLRTGKSFEAERAELTIAEKQNFLLEKLYSFRKLNKYWDTTMIFSLNQVALDSDNEARGIAKTLHDAGYIKTIGYARGVSAEITTEGKAYYEQYIKSRKSSAHSFEEPVEVMDIVAFDKKIESIKTILEERMLGMDDKIDEILEELKSSKQYIEKMDTKSFGQLIKGKLIDIAVDKVLSKETIITIAKFFIENPQQLIS